MSLSLSFDETAALALRQQGMSIYAMSDELSVPASTLNNWLKRRKLPRVATRLGRTFPLERARAMYEAGMSLREIGVELNYTNNAVRRYLRAAGVKMRPLGGPRWHHKGETFPLEEAVRLRKEGLIAREIGARLGYTGQNVHRRLKAVGAY